jgi:sensor histidine kinase YesM
MLLLVFGTGGAIGLHLGLLHVFLWRTGSALFTSLGGSLVFSATTYVMWRWVFPRLGGRTLASQIARQAVVLTIAFTIVSVCLTELVVRLIGAPTIFGTPLGPDIHLTITPQMRQVGVRFYALLPIIPTALIALIAYHQSWQRVITLENRQRELTELAATAQLAALRAQINPHFLFNSLNSIAQLIHVEPDKAEDCVQRLAAIFRYLLRRAEQEFVPLAEELNMVEAYLEIERARFGDRIQIQTHVDPGSLKQLIPNLILQPLVENAVKHGLSRKLGPGTIRIDVRMDGPLLALSVGDDGLGMTDAALGEVYDRGVGLRNLRARLERLYGPAHLPEITSAPGSGTRVSLRLPVRVAEAA